MINLYNQLQTIARHSSSSAKVELLKQYASPQLRELLTLAYDPTITFGVNMEFRAGVFSLGGSYSLAEGPAVPTWEDFKAILARLESRSVTGNAAREALLDLLNGCEYEAHWIAYGILNKDFKIGLGPKSINKAFPNLVPNFECMLAHKDISRLLYPCMAEVKYNGDRNLAIIENRTVTFLSRTGKVIEGHNSVRRELLETFPDNMVIDGEHMKGVWGEEDKDAPMVCYDILPLGAFRDGRHGLFYSARRELLAAHLGANPNLEFLDLSQAQLCHTEEDVRAFFDKVTAQGLEGLVCKPLDGLYEFKRSHNWVKVKPERSADCAILEYLEGVGRNEGRLGAMVVNFQGKRFKLGTGFSDEQRQRLWDEPHLIGRLVEIKYTDLTPYGIPLCASFVKLRDDLGA